MKLVFSGIMVPVSTIDWYSRSVSVIFFNGCNFKCIYCSNNRFIEASNKLEPLFKGGSVVEIEEIEKSIRDAKAFISGVVFSGGEPTSPANERTLLHLAKFAKSEGLVVGIETNGYYPERLEKMIEMNILDKIFLDIKAPLDDVKKYMIITGGREDTAQRVRQSLEIKGMPIEVRTTVFRSHADVLGIAKSLIRRDCAYVIQQGIPENAPDKEIQKERVFTRDELFEVAMRLDFLNDVRIRTKEKGEEKVI